MIFVMIATALLSGTLTALGLWPMFGGFALLAAPAGASITALAVAAAAATWRPSADAVDQDEVPLDALADQLVAELQSVARPARVVPAVRKAG